MRNKEDLVIKKCNSKLCKRKTEHKVKGFEEYNKMYECLKCGTETNDRRNL